MGKIFNKEGISESEYQVIYNMFYNRIYRRAFYIIQDNFLAQDATQDTFLTGFVNLESVKNKDRMGEWLTTIVTRKAIDIIRKQRAWNGVPTKNEYLEIATDTTIMTIENIVENKLLSEELMNQLSGLRDNHREILILKYIHGLKDKEISKQLRIKEGTVKSKIFRAKKALRTKVVKHYITL
ncbi:RNA polymerase sigma factor [Oceanobacillus kapialis]|uniref:RNA polymerase sigma factor n=1 Tax=Oceanobacillus kapialis TaxID=481353 RepID=A0ABW5PY89_9BACI